jgi:RNA polymerase sigma-70 factor (ECF subfamily)
MVGSDDRRLVEQCLAGDRGAFEQLVEKYQKAVYNLALRMVHDPDDAEDVSQNAFLKAFDRLSGYKTEYRFFSWLYRIAVNESLSFLEERRRYENLEDAGAVEDTGQSDTVEADDIREKIEAGLMELKAEYRAVVVLKHFEGLSYEEIGQILEIDEKRVKSRLFTARQLLRDILVRKGLRGDD